jgi:tRNA (cmo5U34)-methyltransferase
MMTARTRLQGRHREKSAPKPGVNPLRRDELFSDKTRAVTDFNFGEATAEVFEDMLVRSVPQYRELQRMLGELAGEFAVSGTSIYDLGCSNGVTLQTLATAVEATGKVVDLVGVDFSEAMLQRARERFAAQHAERQPKLILADLNNGVAVENASVVVLNLTLQFIRPLFRDRLIRQIYEGMNDNGCLLVVEKVLGNQSLFNRLFIQFYYDMKRRNGYSDLEIAKKRESLENVMIPYRMDENVELLKRNGFGGVDTFFKWHNFAGLIAVKMPS